MNYALEVVGLKRHFDAGAGRTLHAVDGVSFGIRPGEILGLVGESGCGKSTLGRTIAGLYDKTEGKVLINGIPTPSAYSARDFRNFSRSLQMIFQDPYSALNPRMTVQDIIAEGPRLLGLWKKDETPVRVDFWLSRVGLSPEHKTRYPHEFSGGQRQRIGIARALALEPKILICDEPISALDVSVQAQVVNLFDDLRRTMNLAILFIAHDLSMVRYISDRMAVMYLGRIVESGPADSVYFDPQHPYTQLLIRSNPDPNPDNRDDLMVTPVGELASAVNLKSGCQFAPRCPLATEKCKTITPEPEEINSGRFDAHHIVACHVVAKQITKNSPQETGESTAHAFRRELAEKIEERSFQATP